MTENISFEYAKKIWEKRVFDFVKTISLETSLGNTEWEVRKMHINIYSANENGLKKRSGSRHRYFINVELQKENAEKIWGLFKQFANQYDLELERWKNNEKDLDRYAFEAKNINTNDSISCHIELPNEWNNPCIWVSVFVGARYHQIDLIPLSN
jgi:beta-galactosidase beta subunit